MKNSILVALATVSSVLGIALCGNVAINNAGFGGFGYYPAMPISGSGMYGGSAGSGGIFGMIIHLFLFIFLIQLLFPNNGSGGLLARHK